MKDRHEPNEVGYGVGTTGKPGSTNLHPGPPQREVKTGKPGSSFYPGEPTDKESANEKDAKASNAVD